MNLRDNCNKLITLKVGQLIEYSISTTQKNTYRILYIPENQRKNLKLLCLDDNTVYENTSYDQILQVIKLDIAKLLP